MASPTRRISQWKDKKQLRKNASLKLPIAVLRNRYIQCSVVAIILVHVIRSTFFPWPTYNSRSERDFRLFRFPSVEDRVKLYMADWYSGPCGDNDFVRVRRNTADNKVYVTEAIANNSTSRREFSVPVNVEVSKLFYFESESLITCSKIKWPIGPYCSESLTTIRTATASIVDWDNRIPILMQFGDEAYTQAYSAATVNELIFDPEVPHIKKFRVSKPRPDPRWALMERTKPRSCQDDAPPISHHRQPIIWKLNAKRHYRDLYLVPRNDCNWEQKMNKAVFRGAATGKGLQNHTLACRELPRCQLVQQYASSKLIDAKLTKLLDNLPAIIDGIKLTAPELSLREMLRYKGIIILEGNDVSSGLKWALLSNSVVLMPPPKYTSWAMEELLEAWVHYIPLREDLSNVEEMVEWMLLHPEEARRISHRASLWIKDLAFHPDSESDDQRIYQEILKRYAAHFRVA